MARFVLRRPVFAWVIGLITMLVGALGLNSLAIEQYPQIAPTTVQVRATYNGASAEIAVVGHEGGTVLVVLNGLRLLADPIRGKRRSA